MKEETTHTTIDKPQATSGRGSGVADLSLESLKRSVSPPPINPRRRLTRKATAGSGGAPHPLAAKSESAKVEAGEVDINDHVSFFSSKLLAAARPPTEGQPRLSHPEWLALYHRNLNDKGHHFVVHQHDHPIAGTHYDLRLQCNSTSSISFALPYGLPGDPNSRRLNRYAIETRVHNLWNHLIETASHETGTMLLWDTGEYEILPYEPSGKYSATDYTTATEGSGTDSEDDFPRKRDAQPEPEKLHHAFQRRKIKLRLNGMRLPKNYIISIRLREDNTRTDQPSAPAFKRRKTTNTNNSTSSATSRRKSRPEEIETSSDSCRSASTTPAAEAKAEPDSPPFVTESMARALSPTGVSFDRLDNSIQRRKNSPKLKRSISSLLRTASPPPPRRTNSVIQSQGQSQQHPTSIRSGSTNQAHSPSQLQPLVPSTPLQPASFPSTAPARTILPVAPSSLNHLGDSTTSLASETAIRQQNAYPGALNTINSIHQRKWFLSLDRAACGFRATNEFAFGRRVWERPLLTYRDIDGTGKEKGEALGGFQAFYVQGRDVERSILTGRLAADVAQDEGLVGYKPRSGWKGITD